METQTNHDKFLQIDNTASANQPMVSIVTPFYNTSMFLAECIESVLRQTYQNWEYILVNNCSTDGSLEIAQEYARQDRRIRIFSNKDFLGQVDNYNHALTYISPDSKYCKMVEADNWIFPHCLTEMVEVAEKHPSVGIVGSYYLFGDKVAGDGLAYPSTRIMGKTACLTHLTKSIPLFGAPTNLLLRSEIVREHTPFYSLTSLHEDTDICYAILQKWEFGFVHQVLTFLRINEGSISSGLADVDSYSLTKLVLFHKYGRWLLPDDSEYQRQHRRLKKRYYEDLVELLMTRRRREVWKLHIRTLQKLNSELSISSLLLAVVWKLGDLLFNPKKTIGNLVRH